MLAATLATAAITPAAVTSARAAAPLRIGVLRFGTVAWELDVIARHDLAPGIAIAPVGLASSPATQTALNAGGVDMIVQDWLWVARLRARGQDWTLAPFSAAVGAVMAAPDGPVRRLADLKGRRLGIAGSPLDKSWLILRAYARRGLGLDLQSATEHSFAAPPLLSEQLRQGRLDAVLTYWPEAARLRAAGMTTILTVEDAIAGLGVGQRMPMTGYVFSAAWGGANRATVDAFLAAGAKAQALLATSDAEWLALRPLTGARDDAQLAALRDAYRAGIPGPFGPATLAAAAKLYDVLAEIGGPALVGDAASLPPGTFWTAAT
jgi:NitT/TauT family transport system substrate-binding protein